MCEILAPVGSKENLISAINAGADAVYLGLKDFSARKSAENFDFSELKYAVAYAKTFNVKVYLAMNTLVKEKELNEFIQAINTAYSLGVDAFILQDVFLGKYLKQIMPDITLHLSTQAGVCNEYGAILAKNCGFSRVILARETKIEDIEKISKIIETEVFIQGALCTCLSGHCYFSSFIGGNSGNRGYCKQPCRKRYSYLNGDKVIKSGYLLSLSDLCVGNDINTLKKLGVASFKIEGRMRSKEYVASSILYYKGLLSGVDDKDLFNYLKISFNRGDYTKGLAFTQKSDFISDKIQNNKGLFVSKITKVDKNFIYFSNDTNYLEGDSFKILSNGVEVASAVAVKVNNQIKIKYNGKVSVNDSVHLTKKVDLYDLLNVKNKTLNVLVNVYIKVGEKIRLSALGKTVESSFLVEEAINSSITKNEIYSNLLKTDVYPFKVTVNFENFSIDAFIVKSQLNKLRAQLYEKIFYENNSKIAYNIDKYINNSKANNNANYNKKAVIVSTVNNNFSNFDDYIYAPFDYNKIENDSKYLNCYLYIPPFASGDDLSIIKNVSKYFKGVYCDGVWAIEFCKENNLKLFAGVGFNVFDSIDVKELTLLGCDKIVVSKELSKIDIENLDNNLYVLNNGLINIMDLIYCPFNKDCKNCKNLNEFILKDENNRNFSVKRYKISECRFKVYNMAKLNYNFKNHNVICDYSLNLPLISTKGNYEKGVK